MESGLLKIDVDQRKFSIFVGSQIEAYERSMVQKWVIECLGILRGISYLSLIMFILIQLWVLVVINGLIVLD